MKVVQKVLSLTLKKHTTTSYKTRKTNTDFSSFLTKMFS